MGQKVRMAVAMVVYTDFPGFWQNGGLQDCLGSRAEDIQNIKVHNFGVPSIGTEDEEVRIEFEEEPNDQKIQEATDSKGE